MASFVDLEDEELIDADENDLYNTIDEHIEEDADNDNENNVEEVPGNENGEMDANGQSTADTTATRVAPKKRIVRNPQPKLNEDRLKGPRGLFILEEWFKDVKFKGKRHEKEDLDAVMSRLEQWSNRLFPKYTFDDCLKRIEVLGHKKPIINYVRRIRLDMEDGFGGAVTIDDVDEPDDPPPIQESDPFDSLMPREPQQTSTQAIQTQTMMLTDEQRERIVRNRLLAEERKLARAKQRAEDQARQQQVAEEIASAVAASQALDDDDFFPRNTIQENMSPQNDGTSSSPNGIEEHMDVV